MNGVVRKLIKITGILCLILVLLAGIFVGFVYWNRFELRIHLDAEEEQLLEYGESYEEPEARVFLHGEYLFQEGMALEEISPRVTGSVDPDTLGIYPVDYEAQFYYWTGTLSTKVFVVDTQCPVINLKDDFGETILPGETYEEPGFTATDNYDGDLTDKVIRKEEAGMITYAVIDSSGNPAYAQREIPYYDPIAPELTLEGEENMVITLGEVFADPGYAASDNCDGDLTEAVVVEGEVDWLNAGIYTLRYSVTDSFLNEAAAERTVEVQAVEWPDTQWPDRKTIYLTFDDGPGPYTLTLLDTLDRYGVKATFFVMDSGYDNVMAEIVRRGHSIGIHTVTHDYEEIYASPEAFFTDLHNMRRIIYDNTGVWTTLMRFPGGGSNTVSKHTCEGLMTLLSTKVRDAGFQYFDWNVDSNDATGLRNTDMIRDNVIAGVQAAGTSIVLQHDINPFSVDAVPEIIAWGKKNGYDFKAIEPPTPGFHHDVLN